MPLVSHFYAHCVCVPVQALHASPRGKSTSGGGKTCSSCFILFSVFFFFGACPKEGGVKEGWRFTVHEMKPSRPSVSQTETESNTPPPPLPPPHPPHHTPIPQNRQNGTTGAKYTPVIHKCCPVVRKIIAGPPMLLSGNNPSAIFRSWWKKVNLYGGIPFERGGIYPQASWLC